MVPNPIKMDDLGGFPYFCKHPPASNSSIFFFAHLVSAGLTRFLRHKHRPEGRTFKAWKVEMGWSHGGDSFMREDAIETIRAWKT